MSREKTVTSRISPIEPHSATGGVKRWFDAVEANLGFIPNEGEGTRRLTARAPRLPRSLAPGWRPALCHGPSGSGSPS